MRKSAKRHAVMPGRLLTVVTATVATVLALGTGVGVGGKASAGTQSGLPGDQKAVPHEMRCIERYAADPQNNYVNWWPAIAAPEHTDAIHSGTQPCATFAASFRKGTHDVNSFVSPQGQWPDIGFVVFDGPNAGYLLGGNLNTDTGQFVAKFDPSTGQQIWKTTLINVYDQTPVQWIAFGSLGIHKNGFLYAAAGPTIWKLDRNTGQIVAKEQQTIQEIPPTDANLDGFGVAPDANGTILMKTQNRPVGCTIQGNGAITQCQAEFGPPADTTVIAADPNTLQTLASIQLNQHIAGRPVITKHDGKIYMYLTGAATLVRIIWNPSNNTLTQDSSWAPDYLLPGQSNGAAPVVLGNWVIANENALGGSVPQCAVAVSQDDPNNLHRLCPWGSTLPAGVPESEQPASYGIDTANSMIYAQDVFVNGVFGIRLNQDTGNMTVVWSRPDWRTGDYFSLEGPANKRVIFSQYISPNFQFSQWDALTYTESVLWANAATGQTLAQSAYNPSTAQGSLPNIGYAGRAYLMGNDGRLYLYEPTGKDG